MKIDLAPHDRRGLMVLEGRRGTFLCTRNDLIGRFLEMYGEWAEAELALLEPLIRPGDVIADVGGNIGAHAVPFAKWVGPKGRVLAFEPQRYLFGLLCANAVINDATALHPQNVAVGSEPGRIAIPAVDYRAVGNYSAVSLADSKIEANAGAPAGDGGPEWVSCQRLDDVFADATRLRLIKIDVEGMEGAVLAGAQSVIRRLRPLIYLEVNRPETGDSLLDRIRALGYRSYWHGIAGFNPGNFARNAENPFGALGDVNVLCVPSEDAFVPANLVPAQRFDDVRKLFPGILGEAGAMARWRRRFRTVLGKDRGVGG
ncbi:MAG: FkbM family methyltransferase [Alphaproteobacteria bacterium]|nr:FkbM family methyltransferase [Alphaproteobacteria bacterium]